MLAWMKQFMFTKKKIPKSTIQIEFDRNDTFNLLLN